jgi:G3E family GTPase
VGLFDADKSATRLPVSLITGFLGSGKTTLLNKLLRHAGMGDSAVIINEFGEVGLDHLLVEAIDGEVAVLASGCVCCTLRSDLEETLRNLLIKRDRGEVPAFSRVLVETTGLADPAPIVQLLLNNPLVSHYLRLDAVVTTVDAVNGSQQIGEHAEAVKQAALADRLLMTKTDLAAADTIAQLDRLLLSLNPGAARHVVSNGEIAPDALFGAALFDPGRKTADVRRWINESAYQAQPHGNGHDGHAHDEHAQDGHAHDKHAHDLAEHAHTNGIRACCLTSDEPLSWDAVSTWLARAAAKRGGSGSVARQRHSQSDRRERAGRHPWRPSRVSSARAARRLAGRRSALPHHLHHTRNRARRPAREFRGARRRRAYLKTHSFDSARTLFAFGRLLTRSLPRLDAE